MLTGFVSGPKGDITARPVAQKAFLATQVTKKIDNSGEDLMPSCFWHHVHRSPNSWAVGFGSAGPMNETL